MVSPSQWFCMITLVPLAEELRDADPTLLYPVYADDAVFDQLARRSVVQLRLLIDRELNRGYFPDPAKPLFVTNNPEEKGSERQEFERAVLHINYVDVIRYLGIYLGPMEELEAWVRSKVESWSHGVRTLSKIAKVCPQSAYSGLGVSL